jgi:hypothetical protein
VIGFLLRICYVSGLNAQSMLLVAAVAPLAEDTLNQIFIGLDEPQKQCFPAATGY